MASKINQREVEATSTIARIIKAISTMLRIIKSREHHATHRHNSQAPCRQESATGTEATTFLPKNKKEEARYLTTFILFFVADHMMCTFRTNATVLYQLCIISDITS